MVMDKTCCTASRGIEQFDSLSEKSKLRPPNLSTSKTKKIHFVEQIQPAEPPMFTEMTYISGGSFLMGTNAKDGFPGRWRGPHSEGKS